LAFQPEFKPIARVGENVLCQPEDKYGYFKIIYIEPLPEIVHDFGPLDPDTGTGDKEITALYMPDGEMAQYRIIPLDDIVITALKQPLAKTRWSAKNVNFQLTKTSLQQVMTSPMHIAEIFVLEDEKVYFNVKNPTQYRQLKNRAKFIGFRYKLEKLTARPSVYTVVPVEGM